MQEKIFDIETPGGRMNSFVYYPDQGGPFPAVNLHIDAAGVREPITNALVNLLQSYLHAPVVAESDQLHELFLQVQRGALERRASTLDSMRYRQAMANFATGYAVVTLANESGPTGAKVNSLTSVSLDPPILLVCFVAWTRPAFCAGTARRSTTLASRRCANPRRPNSLPPSRLTQICGTLLRLLGAYGSYEQLPLSTSFTSCKTLEIDNGASEVHRENIARELLREYNARFDSSELLRRPKTGVQMKFLRVNERSAALLDRLEAQA